MDDFKESDHGEHDVSICSLIYFKYLAFFLHPFSSVLNDLMDLHFTASTRTESLAEKQIVFQELP